MRKILAFSASNSPTSINHQLILNVTERISAHPVTVLKLKEDDFPIYSIVKEKEGFPENVEVLYKMLQEHGALIISVNEYNANVGGFFKNILDWLSRLDRKFLENKKILLMSTSPGKRGGASALEYCKNQFPRFGGEIVESFSLPQFYENFDSEKGSIVNEVFDLGIAEVVTAFSQEIKE
ncbi:MAG: NADPH-dependent FMN reductase [Salinimicrobium sediminis]|uniref:NAD(P)H-dependent FMN reductase n=1 Tax=Salinimicrobium sediminis TaxID=1343891 RepID=A0A285X530_9FLAO|nr:NADPH-dependent FMN reductase [Salinimicrobium sediminis]MDX1602162.1 NADPH-dependent FMN reductase [Salinimicrobium sediminis]MDX1753285.1 NADPH-dependent FMN reductase [Salinimicrobium sediminis]SOC80441.1 NAD(P)H-dependent FMN reductase [Salinimicrobium sediminis]